ncbi:hypothetical protein EPUS_02063 [Endocarpon pusillum Z07020]|uniref:RRM domain-containing protein n=1 Tax=Endocarpon pusillum (strain Z07020 / HMAS-L-300199) TaxID=1263415 RepID=U1GQX2_ENDPU|nr:uncharacterized protein EPUS_02063 [Endocarpon pusillum Z07020]ERF74376.1 hypothetical protein EPUS_02063 [Endocarpon pusillum Z07020]
MASTRNVNGILAIPAAVTGKKASTNSSAAPKLSPRTGSQKLRLIVRRLPPGLTQAEFEVILGEEWRVGAGRVDWFAYKDGKISKDSAKPSRPARAYLRMKDQAMLDTLSAVVKQCVFQDAKNTSKDPCLLGPPSLEFAPYGRVPGSRVRKDGRQGTIDQDPEFIDFLQSLTEPVTRSNASGEVAEGIDTRPAKVTTTPLVEYLKEKKANKGKESATSKTAKPQGKSEAKDTKVEKIDSKKVSLAKKEAQRSPETTKTLEKATHEAVKAINKPMAAVKGKSDALEPTSPPSKAPVTAPTTAKRERERGSVSVAAKILQRDLGLTPVRGDRRNIRSAGLASKSAEEAEPERKPVSKPPTTLSSDTAPEATTTTPTQPSTLPANAVLAAPTGPRSTKSPMPTSQPVNRPASAPSGRPSRPAPGPTPGARSAFLKHANFSQGVTEELLYTAFCTFGTVTRCEIDRKKGFGYVDFEDTESLKKAMLASPVKVGDKGGQVVVLENKSFKMKPQTPVQVPTHTAGKVASQPQTPPPMSTKAEIVANKSTTPAVTTAPTAPRGAHIPFRGGSQHHGTRGAYNGPSRGGLNRAGRGGRANSRGRGAMDSNRGGGHAKERNMYNHTVTEPAGAAGLGPPSASKMEANGPAG